MVAGDLTHALQLGQLSGNDAPAVRRRVRREWPAVQRLRVGAELAAALAHLHDGAIAGCVVIHRDLKVGRRRRPLGGRRRRRGVHRGAVRPTTGARAAP